MAAMTVVPARSACAHPRASNSVRITPQGLRLIFAHLQEGLRGSSLHYDRAQGLSIHLFTLMA